MRAFNVAAFALAHVAVADKTPVNAALYPDLARYAAFASAAYSSNCAVPPYGAVAETYFTEDSTSTAATLFRDDATQEYILSWRGTADIQGFLTNLDQDLIPCTATGINCNGCTCHQGYLNQYNSIFDQVMSGLESGLAAHNGYSLTVTGHSMGGSLASISAASLKGQGYSPIVYTYGQSRTGDQAYADYIDQQFGGEGGIMYRVTHGNDGVPQVPFESDGYRHHSTEYWQSADPAAETTTYQCQGQEPQDCNQSEIGYGIGNGGRGINAAHLKYFDLSIGNPLNTNAACNGIN